MSTEDLVTCLRHHLRTILKDRPIQSAYLHGSAARGEMMPFSDVDIALPATRVLPPEERLRLMLDVSLEVD